MYGKKRVVITGLGAVTPVGTDVETAWENIKKVYLESDDLQELIRTISSKSSGEINDFEVEKYIDKKKRAVWIALHNICSSSSENGSCRCKA